MMQTDADREADQMPADIPADPCRWCDQPQTVHPRYTSWIGDHEWTPRPDNTARAVADIDRALAITAGRLAETTQTPTAVRHPEGGLTVEWVPDTPSNRLPPRKAWPAAPPVPRFRTGRVPTGPATENPAPQREPGGVSNQPTPLTPEQESKLAAAGLEGAAAGRYISAVFRRILNATKRKDS